MVSVMQADREPWLQIWHEGREKTWMHLYKNMVDLVNYKSTLEGLTA